MKLEKKICFITGTRADYGLMRSTLREIEKKFILSLIVVGMHLSGEFGNTIKEIKRDGFKIVKKISTLSKKDTGGAMAESLGLSLIGIIRVLEVLRPDMLLVLGDMGYALAGAISGMHLNIPVVHLHGGEQGDDGAHIDDSIRHSITKFAHIHLAPTKRSAERIVKMGEEKWRVHVVGAPGLDDIWSQKLQSKKYIERTYQINFNKPFFLIVQHPVLTQLNEAGKQIKETLEALKKINGQTILIYPNADAGGREMIKVIKRYEKYDFLKIYKSLPRKDYLSILRYSSALIGNSSSGLIEAPCFKIPVINIGVRNSTRENAGNVIFANYDKEEIIRAINKALFSKEFKNSLKVVKNFYGDGKASKRIVRILKELKVDTKTLLRKRITY